MTITNKVSSKSVMAGNTPIADVVDAPTIGTATAGAEQATITFTAAATGGAATSFGAISTPGSITGTSATSPITVTGLTGNTSYTFKTYGINSSGTWSNVLSSSSNSVTPSVATAYESISTITPSGQSSFSFTSIPSTYKHLQIRFLCIPDQTYPSLIFTFNGSSTGYTLHLAKGNGTTTSSSGSTGRTSMSIFWGQGMLTTYGNVAVMDILDYASTTKTKVARSISGQDNNSGTTVSGVELMSHFWNNTNAISSIEFLVSGGGPTLLSGSSIALYGIKG